MDSNMASIPSAPIGGWAKLRNYSVSTYESALPYEDNDIIGHQGCSGARAKQNVPSLAAIHSKATATWFLDSAHLTFVAHFNDVIAVISLYLLLESSVHQLWLSHGTEIAFETVNTCCFGLLVIEVFLTTWAKSTIKLLPEHVLPNIHTDNGLMRHCMKLLRTCRRLKFDGYFLSFLFFLDVVNVIILIFDLHWMDLHNEWEVPKEGQNNWGRVFSMLRLVRLGKLYQIVSNRNNSNHVVAKLEDLQKNGVITAEEMKEKADVYRSVHGRSRVGKELSDTTMIRIMFGFLLMLCLVPLLTFHPIDKMNTYATETLHQYNVLGSDPSLDIALQHFLSTVDNTNTTPSVERIFVDYNKHHATLLYLNLFPTRGVVVDLPRSSFRHHELQEHLFVSPDGGVVTEAIFSTQRTLNIRAVYSILLTAIVTFMLMLGAWLVNQDVKYLVLVPIERMMEKIEYTALNPLQQDDQPCLTCVAIQPVPIDTQHSAGEYEMRLLETAVTKITGLLRVGFGGAGADIISKHLHMDGLGGAVVNPMIPGNCVHSIFGFCEIHQFDNITKVLNEEVMTFVNSISAIVHATMSAWDGECNKNLGSSFLMVWRIGNADEVSHATRLACGGGYSPRGGQFAMYKNKHIAERAQFHRLVKCRSVNLQRVPGVDSLADKSLIAFIKILDEVKKESIQSIGSLSALIYTLPKMIISPSPPKISANDYTSLFKKNDHHLCDGTILNGLNLGMGFGLHAGWAIEGAVGSMKKVDTTYLSPHVNLAARMMTTSRQYGVQILATEDFYKILSNEAQSCMRKLDVVAVKGSQVPIPIYTYDTDILHHTARRMCQAQFEESMEAESAKYTPKIWNHDRRLVQLRALCTPEFRKLFDTGVKDYIEGQWDKAEVALRQADKLKLQAGAINGDGPSQALLTFMENRGFIPLKDWKGYRELNSK